MTLLRKVSWLFALAIAFSAITVPIVRAHTLSITDLNAPSRILLGTSITVTVTVQYELSYNGRYIDVIIYDGNTCSVNDDACTIRSRGTVVSSPDSCMPLEGTRSAQDAVCIVTPTGKSGIEILTFGLQASHVDTYPFEIRAAIYDSSYNELFDTFLSQDFSVRVFDKFDVTIRAEYPVVVTVDSVPQMPGNVFASLYPGTHALSVPSIVKVDNSTRLVFASWSDGSTETTRIVNVQDDITLTVNYITQHTLTLMSTEANATGSGWYNSDSKATFSIPSRASIFWVFQGWYEGSNLVTKSNSGSISMNSPHTLTARWGLDYPLLAAVIGAIAAAGVGLAYYRKKLTAFAGATKPRRRRTSRSRTVSEPAPTLATVSEETAVKKEGTRTATGSMFCTQCGARITRDSKFCKECGSKQT